MAVYFIFVFKCFLPTDANCRNKRNIMIMRPRWPPLNQASRPKMEFTSRSLATAMQLMDSGRVARKLGMDQGCVPVARLAVVLSEMTGYFPLFLNDASWWKNKRNDENILFGQNSFSIGSDSSKLWQMTENNLKWGTFHWAWSLRDYDMQPKKAKTNTDKQNNGPVWSLDSVYVYSKNNKGQNQRGPWNTY